MLPVVLLPALGGLATGVVALTYPEVLYQGFGKRSPPKRPLSRAPLPAAAMPNTYALGGCQALRPAARRQRERHPGRATG